MRGDERAFSRFYRRYARYVASVVYRAIGADAETEDIVHDTFVEVLRSIASLKDPGRIKPWLATIAVRMARRRLDKRTRRRRLRDALGGLGPTTSNPRDSATLDDLLALLEEFPAEHRQVWVLNRIEGQTIPLIADAFGISESTVKRRLRQVETRVRRQFDA